MTVHGFRLFAVSYCSAASAFTAPAFFTALCNGAISALLSFLAPSSSGAGWYLCPWCWIWTGSGWR